MANGIRTALANDLLDHVLRNTAYTSPTNAYLSLFSTAPTAAGGGTELTGNGYARESITCSAAAAGAITNTNTITFTASGGAWSQVVGHAVHDTLTVGQMQFFEDSVAGPTLADGDSYQFGAGDVDASFT